MATGMAESKAHLAEVDDSNYDKLEQQFEEVRDIPHLFLFVVVVKC